MSTCPDSDLFSAYVDGEVPSPWKEKLEEHIASCRECTERTNRYVRLHQLVATSCSEPALDLDASFMRLSMRRSERLTVKQGGHFSWMNGSIRLPVPAMAALFLFALLIPAYFSFRAGMQSSRQVPVFASSNTDLTPLAMSRDDLRRLPVSDAALISNDFPVRSQSDNFLNSGKKLFTVVNYSSQFFPDSNMFNDAEIVIIRLPNLTLFTGDDQLRFASDTLVPVSLFEK